MDWTGGVRRHKEIIYKSVINSVGVVPSPGRILRNAKRSNPMSESSIENEMYCRSVASAGNSTRTLSSKNAHLLLGISLEE